MRIWEAAMIFCLLCILSRQDVEAGRFDGRYLLLPVILGILGTWDSRLFLSGGDRLLALLPGAGLTLFSLAGRGAVGEGDGLLIWSLGYRLPAGGCFFLLAGSMLLAGLAGSVRILMMPGDRRKRLREERLALLPFVTIVYAVEMLAYYAGGELF